MTEQIGPRSKMPRGLSQETRNLRRAIRYAFELQDKPVTVRQLYYRLTVIGACAKTESGYKRVQRQLVEMRRQGLVPYDWIADNTRWMRKPHTYDGLGDFLAHAKQFYRQDLWARAKVYTEVWCEKDALAGVINPITSGYDVPLMVARGYASESFAYEAAENIRQQAKPPDTLRELVRAAIERHLDPNHLAALEREETLARETLRQMMAAYG